MRFLQMWMVYVKIHNKTFYQNRVKWNCLAARISPNLSHTYLWYEPMQNSCEKICLGRWTNLLLSGRVTVYLSLGSLRIMTKIILVSQLLVKRKCLHKYINMCLDSSNIWIIPSSWIKISNQMCRHHYVSAFFSTLCRKTRAKSFVFSCIIVQKLHLNLHWLVLFYLHSLFFTQEKPPQISAFFLNHIEKSNTCNL